MKETRVRPDELIVLWTTKDKDVAMNMVFMYALNSKRRGWWKEVCLIIWGPSAKLLAEDTDLQDHVRKMKDAGVSLLACKACSDSYGVSDILETLGVNVMYVGESFTRFLKEDHKIITL